MIISWLTGGLGNQMFQYAAGLALATQHRTALKLDPSWYQTDHGYGSHVKYGLSCFNLTEEFATQQEIDLVRGLPYSRRRLWTDAAARALGLRPAPRHPVLPPNWHCPPTFAYYPEFFAQPDNTYLQGMFQSEKFFAPVADLLRHHFSIRYPATPEVEAFAARIRSGPSIAVNFRRGDYVSNESVRRELGVLGVDYYHRAVRLLRERSPDATLYIFSDDIEAVARDFAPDGSHEFVRCVQPGGFHDTLRLMSLCEHMAVANSSFSWWAAWLNPTPDRLVIAPDPWFVQSPHDLTDVVPTNWVRLPAFC